MSDTANEQPLVLWQVADGVGHIILNRPQAANAISTAMGRDLCAAIAQAARADIGAVLLSARGKQFCAGGDINEFLQRQHDLDAMIAALLGTVHAGIHTLATLDVPVVSALQGPAGGAGISLALCADFVLAAPAMKLRGGYSAIGLSPDLGASYYLARRAGPARAKHVLMTNRPVPAEACLRWGLIDELHAADALMDAAQALAAELARGATASLGGIKRLCDSALDHDLAAHLDLERDALLRCARAADVREGISAFVEKRAPHFSDKRLS